MKIFLRVLVVALLVSSCSSKLGKVLKSKDFDYKLKMAEQFYVQKKYIQAQQVYEDIMPHFRGTEKYEDIFYKYTYSAYNLKDYANAESLFKTFAETFPNSARLEEAEYMRAYSYYKQSPKVELDQTPTSKTIALMQAFINSHPNSSKIKEANEIIDLCRAKLELKEFKGAQLYFDLGYFKSAGVAFSVLMDNYPDSENADMYKLAEIKSYYKYATLSILSKQKERFQKVISEFEEFEDRFESSPLLTEAKEYKTLSEKKINNLQNEQVTQTSK